MTLRRSNKPMRREAKKRTAAMRVYRKRRDEFLAEHTTCENPLGCPNRAEVLHHRRGRFGGRLLDERYWSAACSPCNDWAETHTGEALACGWLLRIEAVS